MSKEIAQTVGTKRMAWLIALIAAFAVFATVGSQFRGAKADIPSVTVSCVDDAGATVNPGQVVTYICSATVTGVPGGTTTNTRFDITVDSANLITASYTENSVTGPFVVAECSYAAPVVSCVDAAGPITSFTFSFSFTVQNGGDGDLDVASACSISDDGAGSATCDLSSLNVATINGVTSTSTTTILGGQSTVTFTIPSGLTYCSDGTGGDARLFAAGDQTASGLNVVSTTPSTAVDTGSGTHTVVVTDDATAGGSVTLSTHQAGEVAGANCAPATATLTAANFVVPELRHIADDGSVIALKDIVNNVRGSAHTVCTVADNGASADSGVLIPQLTVNSFVITAGGGYNGSAPVGPQSPTFTDPQLSTLTVGGSSATCLTYLSTGAGDQQISAEYLGLNGTNVTIDWDTDNDGNELGTTPLNASLVKEWNVLEGSTLGGGVSGSGASVSVTKTISIQLNPATGLYTFTPLNVTDYFYGSHTDSSNATVGPISLAGVAWTAVLSGCGTLSGTLSGTTTLLQDGTVGNTPNVTFSNNNDCGPASTATITFTGNEPANLGSGVGRTVTEVVNINFSVVIPTKQVFLAWAGQRIILEHDWRLPPGDANPANDADVSVVPVANSVCAVASSSFDVTYVKGSGPGNFLPALGNSINSVYINGNDEAIVEVNDDDAGDNSQSDDGTENVNGGQTNGDVIRDPNDSCISRVLYESEDPGEVDIEAFISAIPSGRALVAQMQGQVGAFGASKVAFVVYYMKLNTVNVSLVDDVAKPGHNTTGSDYSPGNPWDASKDVATVDWNVSKDLLVRGRVTGWFLNSNPSGRAADTTDPLNVLPANRWVMPNDWVLLAGGPADNADNSAATGTAEAFRPQYDIMVNPGRGNRGLDTPEGTQLSTVAVLGVELAATGTTMTVKAGSGVALITAGKFLRIDNEDVEVLTVLGPNATLTLYSFTVNRGQRGTAPAVHVINSQVLLYSTNLVPFEGPFSLLDLPALGASAALSDFDPNNVRDTIWADGDVDWWDAPMPPALVTVDIRGTGFIKQVLKQDVYFNGTASGSTALTPTTSAGQTFPNPYYIVDIPDSPWIAPIAAGGGYAWDTWGTDGPGGNGQGVYRFWTAIPQYANASVPGANPAYISESLTASATTELTAIQNAYSDATIGRTLVVYSDNHGEFMVTANGDYKTDLTACASSPLGGATSKHCKPGDKVGTGTIYATADYQDFRGKHFPVKSNTATVTWLWGGYKDVTVEAGETDQFKYVVFHGLDRDGYCAINAATGTSNGVLLHPVLSGATNDTFNGNPAETVDFLIDSGEGIIIGSSSSAAVNVTKQFATGATTFSTAVNTSLGTPIKQFPLSSLAAAGALDECQTWIRVSNSLLGVLNVLVIAHDDTAEGDIGFDKIIDLTNTTSYTLNFRWSLVTWAGANDIAVADAIKGTGTSGKNPGGNDISASVTAIYGWDQAAQQWLGYFPSGVNVPGANDLTALKDGSAYWIAITGPGSVTWTIASNVD